MYLPPLFPFLLPTLSVYVTHYLSLYPPLSRSLSLQEGGLTALMLASEQGHTEAMKLLLNASDIDVNHADVSLYLLIPSHLVLGGRVAGDLPHLIPL